MTIDRKDVEKYKLHPYLAAFFLIFNWGWFIYCLMFLDMYPRVHSFMTAVAVTILIYAANRFLVACRLAELVEEQREVRVEESIPDFSHGDSCTPPNQCVHCEECGKLVGQYNNPNIICADCWR